MDWNAEAIAWEGTVYRFASVEFASKEDLITGEGARKHAGRWNPKGLFPALYTSLTPETALAETRAHYDYYGFDFADATPVVLTSLQVKLTHVLDVSLGPIRTKLRASFTRMQQEDWRLLNRNGQVSLTQSLGEKLWVLGFEAILVPSFANAKDNNLVIFPDKLRRGSMVTIGNVQKLPPKKDD